jgi:hypothetical protein
VIANFLAGARRGLDNHLHRSWQESLASQRRAPGRLLAWAPTADEGVCIAANGVLSIGSVAAGRPGGHDYQERPSLDWRHLGWHRIERGGFDADSSTLRWTLYADSDQLGRTDPYADDRLAPAEQLVKLQRPGRLPLVFRDRVGASIIVEQFIPLTDRPTAPGRRLREPGVIISGRRDLAAPDARIEWHASVPQGISWNTPGIEELAAESIRRLRGEYDPHG